MNVAKWKDVWRRFSGRGAYPHELAAILLIPLRRIVLSPEKLIPHLHLVRTSRVLEVGPGPGFFSIAVARAVPQGRLELVDIQREMLGKARHRLQRAGATNVGYTQASATTLPFQSRTFDVAFLVAVLGEVPDPRACLSWSPTIVETEVRVLFIDVKSTGATYGHGPHVRVLHSGVRRPLCVHSAEHRSAENGQ